MPSEDTDTTVAAAAATAAAPGQRQQQLAGPTVGAAAASSHAHHHHTVMPATTKAAEADAHTPREVLCFINAHSFRLIWVLSLVLYVFVSVQLVLYAGFYYVLMGFPSVSYYMDTFRLISVDQFPLVVAAYALLALLFFRELFRLFALSIRQGRLCMTNEAVVATAKIAALDVAAATSAHRPKRNLVASLRRMWTIWFGFLSVKGPHFELVMLTRELVEIIVQVVQAYQSSRYTPNGWLNFCYGALIVVNCLSSPIISFFAVADLGRERMWILLMDLLLDVVWLVLPLLLFPHYLRGFFGTEAVLYQDTFMVRALMESQLILVSSHLDIVSKLMPSLSVYYTIRKIRTLLRRSAPVATTGATTHDDAACPHQRLREAHSTNLPRLVRYRQLAERVLVRILLALGAFTLAMYLLVLGFPGQCESGCKLVLHPWFVYSKCRCAVQEISCYERGIAGHADELQRVFAAMERPGMQSLILSHCPELHVPPEIHWFRDLYGLEIYNSTIASWPQDAAIARDVYYKLGVIFLVRTNLAAIPEGLLQGDLPPTLLEIDIVVSNLTTLPADLDAKWAHVRTVYLDHGQLQTPPSVLGRMQLQSLSLYNNSIARIPDDTFAASSLNYLLLNGNPLDALPASLGDVRELYELQLQETNVSRVSRTWADGQTLAAGLRIYARGAPVCRGHDEPLEPANAGAPVVASVDSGGFAISCAVRGSLYQGERSLAYFALEGKTRERAIRGA